MTGGKKRYVRSLFTSAPNRDFGIKEGELYEFVGYPFNTNSGCIFIIESDGHSASVWREDYFENVS